MDLQDADGIESEKFVIFQQDDLHIESFPLMKEIRRQGKLCDVTLKVSKKRKSEKNTFSIDWNARNMF